MRARVKFRVIDSVRSLDIPQPTERQRIGNQIDAAMIFARANFVNVLSASHRAAGPAVRCIALGLGGMVVSSLGRVAQTNQSVAR